MSKEKNIRTTRTLRINLQALSFTRKSFENLDLNKCINRLIYGQTLIKLNTKSNPKSEVAQFYILETDNTKLQWIPTSKGAKGKRIDLKVVSNISEIPSFVKNKIPKKYKYKQDLLLSITYEREKELLLIFEDEDQKNEWWCGLQFFVEEALKTTQDQIQTTRMIAREFFAQADTDGTKALDKNEVRGLLRQLQIYVKNKEFLERFEKFDKDKNGLIDIEEFETMTTEMFRKVDELLPLFKKYAPAYVEGVYNQPAMTLFDLMRFFQVEQKQLVSLESLQKIRALEFVQAGVPSISFDFFCILIFSTRNTILDPSKSYVYQDMTRPLTDYYINSSHNTYLLSNQLTGESSVLAYINALNRGCRCVELDIWTGPNSTPIIYHGHTMTTKILFKDVIMAIKKHAFLASPFPLILSFEMHCDIKTQKNMVEILHKELGDMIFSVPQDFERYGRYPSPEELQKKIIIKGTGKLKKTTAIGQPSQQNCDEEEYKIQSRNAHTDVLLDNNIIPDEEEDSDESLGDLSERMDGSQEFIPLPRVACNPSPLLKSRKGSPKHEEDIEHSSCVDDDGYNTLSASRNIPVSTITGNQRLSSKLSNQSWNVFENRKNFFQPPQKPVPVDPVLTSEMKSKPSNPQFLFSDNELKTVQDFLLDLSNSNDKKSKDTREIDLEDIALDTKHSPPKEIKAMKSKFLKSSKDNTDYPIEVFSDDQCKPSYREPLSVISKDQNKRHCEQPTYQPPESIILLSRSDLQFNKSRNNLVHTTTTANVLSVAAAPNTNRDREVTKRLLYDLNVLFGMIGRRMDLNDKNKRTVWEISSLNESKIAKLNKTHHRELVDFHRNFFSRIYPLGSRIDSSNYDPISSWCAGSQIVALNYQKNDEPMLLNYAKFVTNGGIHSGYVLKPEYMLKNDDDGDGNLNVNQNGGEKKYPADCKKPIKKLTVQIISGQQIRPDNFVVNQVVDPFVEVKIRGLEIDEQNNNTHRTHIVKDNGFNPNWSKSPKFEFQIHAPDFCFLVITAYHGEVIKKDRLGWYAIEFNNIQEGYRVVPLLNNLFAPIKNSYIFCHISIGDIK